MKWFLDLGNRYAKNSDWTDFALTKFCLFSMGILAGIKVDEKYKKKVGFVAIFVFIVTYIPLMLKMLKMATEKE